MRIAIASALLLAACVAPIGAAPKSASPPVGAPPAPTDLPVSRAEPTPTAASTTALPVPASKSRPVAGEDPVALAEQIKVAERAVRDESVHGEDLAWMANLQQLAYRRLAERPQWRDAVVPALPDDVRPAAIANLDAGADLRALTTPRDELPRWRIVEPAPADELMRHYREAEAEFGVAWRYLAAIHLIETRMGRIRGTSVAGAQGPMQFMPATWAAFGVGDVNDDRDSIHAAARYLRHNGAPANMASALFRYNNSERYVRAVTAYAEVMRADPLAYRGYYHWQVYYRTSGGDVLLPVGYRRD